MAPNPVPTGVAPLALTLHLARTKDAGDPYSFPFGKGRPGVLTYLRTRTDGTSAGAELAWDAGVFSDLAGLRSAVPDPARLPSLGGRLRSFLEPLGWEADVRALGDVERTVHLTLELGAAELFALPWEAVELASGARLGKLPRCLLRYQWPGSTTAPRAPDPPPENGRILVAWSAGGRGVPHDEHLAAIRRAYQDGEHPDAEGHVVELADASLRWIGEALAAHAPVHVLHLVCHGAAAESDRAVYGLRLCTADGTDHETVDPERLADKLRPYAGTLRLLVLCACHGGDAGAIDSRLGSVALALHRAGIPAVVASRYPLSWDGCNRLAEALYRGLLVERTSLEDAFLAARARLVELAADEGNVDWASLQLYARAEDGPDQRPVVVRPYRGLLSFQREHARYFCGRGREVDEAVSDLTALVEARDAAKPRFLVVTGASGTGKSSLVLAGLVPALARRDPRWVVPPALRPTLDWTAAIERALAAREDPSAPLLLVVDQLEEVFTVLADKASRQAFMQRLWALARDPAGGVAVVATLRVDFLGRCGEIDLGGGDGYLERVVYDEAHRVFVQRMAKEELRAAIEQPAAAAGLDIDPGLAARMIEDAGDEPGALPLCEYTLDELWKRRRGRRLSGEDYDRLGGVAGALVARASAILDGLDEIRRRAARRLLVQLVDAREDAALDTRRRVQRAALRRGPPAEAAVQGDVLDTLARERLVVVSGEAGAAVVEIAHEQLIRSFGKLRAWVSEDRAMLASLAELSAWVAEAEKYGQHLDGKKLAYARVLAGRYGEEIEPAARQLIARSDRAEGRRQRLWRVLAVVAAAAAVLLGWATFWALRQRTEARAAMRLAGARELAARGKLAAATGVLVDGDVPQSTRGWNELAHEILQRRVPHAVLHGHEAGGISLAWSPDGKWLATASDDKTARVWDAAQGRVVAVFSGHRDAVRSIAWSPDGKRIVTASDDKTARVWSAADGREVALLSGHGGSVRDAAWSPDGKRIVTASDDKTARVWSAQTGKPIVRFARHGKPPFLAAWSLDGARVASVASEDGVRVWRAADGHEIAAFGEDGIIESMAWSPDGTRILTSDINHAGRVWDPADGRALVDFGRGGGHFSVAVWSPSGEYVATADQDDRAAQIWRADGVDWAAIDGHTGGVHSIAWSPDGARVATASDDKTARIWETVARGEDHLALQLALLEGYDDTVTSVRWSPDGKSLATASRDGTVLIWSTADVSDLARLEGEPLRRALADATTVCLDPSQRQTYLAEPEADARAGYEACERGHGRTPPAAQGHAVTFERSRAL